MNKEFKILVDVDNTLCDFSTPLHVELSKINPEILEPESWDKWDFYKDYGITGKEFYQVVDDLHSTQNHSPPFPHMKSIVNLLYNTYHITIASHRKNKYKIHLMEWLDKNEIRYDDVYCGKDKTELFNDFVAYIIDDSPKVLKAAYNFGIPAIGIKYPWNSHLSGYKDIYLYSKDTLIMMLALIAISKK